MNSRALVHKKAHVKDVSNASIRKVSSFGRRAGFQQFLRVSRLCSDPLPICDQVQGLAYIEKTTSN